jgi:hypothetical protein
LSLPNTKIGYITYKVVETDKWTTGALKENEQRFGEIDYFLEEIHVAPNLSREASIDTYLHENIHGILSTTGFFEGDELAEEKFVLAFTPRLLEWIRKNPRALEAIR